MVLLLFSTLEVGLVLFVVGLVLGPSFGRGRAVYVSLEVLEIDNNDKLIETIKKNGLKEQFSAQFLPALIMLAKAADPQLGMAAEQAALAAGLIEAPQQQALPGGAPGAQPAETDVNGGIKRANAYNDRQRAMALARTTPQG